jgi:NAD(P)-dependent dehydrogenase (short-subunit alcohol dehydrogenase family)
MLLKGKSAVIYGAGGAVGSATARAFAREGARLFLAGKLELLDAGHYLLDENPDAVADLIERIAAEPKRD